MALRNPFKLISHLTIRQKLIFTICGGTILTVVLTSAIILHQVSRLIERELINKGTIIATSLSKQCIEPIMHDDLWALYKLIKSAANAAQMPFVVYVSVLDRKGKVLAHSQPRHFRVDETMPEGPFNEKALAASETTVQVSSLSKHESLFDITAPCVIGTEKVGIVRVGLSDSLMRRELSGVKMDVSLIALLLSIFGVVVSTSVAYRITGRLRRVTQNIVKISEGQIEDVSPVKSVEKDEVGQMVEIFNEMAKSLKTQKEMDEYVARKDKLAMLGEFSAGVAHEIKNPLTSIKMLLQSTIEKRKPLNTADMEVIEDEINRIDRIVRDFLAFARPAQTECMMTSLNEIVKEVVTLTRSEMENAGIEARLELPEGIPDFMAQREGIRQVVLNVVLNAIQAMEHGGTLTISSSFGDGTAAIRVADSGAGITKDDLGHIFDPFYTTKSNGTGMGLAIAERIVREHGGHITVTSEPAKGTEFLIEIPV